MNLLDIFHKPKETELGDAYLAILMYLEKNKLIISDQYVGPFCVDVNQLPEELRVLHPRTARLAIKTISSRGFADGIHVHNGIGYNEKPGRYEYAITKTGLYVLQQITSLHSELEKKLV